MIGIDQPVRAASLAPHGHPYDVPEVCPFFRWDTKFSLSAVVAEFSNRDVAVNCRKWHQGIRNSNNFMLVIEFHQNSIRV